MLQVFQRQVLQLTLQLIQTQLMGEWGIEIGGLLTDLVLGAVVIGIFNLSHQVHPVGNHDEDDAHVLSKRQQQVAEVLRLNDGIFLVQLLDALQTMQDAGYALAKLLAYLVNR